MSENPMKDFEQLMRDTAYAAVGLGVLGFQKAQVRRQELADALGGPGATLGQLGEQITAQVRAAGEAVRPQIDALRPQLESLRPQAEAVSAQFLSMLKSVDEYVAPARRDLDDKINDLEAHLPSSAQSTVAQLRAAAAQREAALRRSFGWDNPAPDAEPTPAPTPTQTPTSPVDDTVVLVVEDVIVVEEGIAGEELVVVEEVVFVEVDEDLPTEGDFLG